VGWRRYTVEIVSVRPTEVVTRTGTARELLSPNTPGDEWYGQPILLQLPGEDVGSESRSRSLLVEQVSFKPDGPDVNVEVRFVDKGVDPVRIGVDEVVTVQHVKIVGL
jgi:hypothetical protein